jgi:hypothetical protein
MIGQPIFHNVLSTTGHKVAKARRRRRVPGILVVGEALLLLMSGTGPGPSIGMKDTGVNVVEAVVGCIVSARYNK